MKPITHKKITSLALEHVNSELALSDFHKYEILKGVQKEDDPTISRLLNWHFYPANKSLATKRWFLEPNSFAILKRREKSLYNAVKIGKKNSYRILGRILHHIQDMSTPSHVIPVYHSAGLSADPFETFLVTNWSDIEPLLHVDNPRESAPDNYESYSQMYLKSGQRLLESLKDGKGLFPLKNLKTGERISADMFWRENGREGIKIKAPLAIDGFGSFGEYGRNFCDRSLDELFSRKKVAAFFMNLAMADTSYAVKHFQQKVLT